MKKSEKKLNYSKTQELHTEITFRLAEQGRLNLHFFCHKILKYPDIIDDEQIGWCNNLQRLKENLNPNEINRFGILGSKDTFKSTIATIGFPLWNLIQLNGRNMTSLIGNAVGNKAQTFLSEIKWHIEHNELFIECYGRFDELAEKWNMSKLLVERPVPLKEPTIEAIGMGGSISSQHPGIVILDDWSNEKNSVNKAGLVEQRRTFKEIIATLSSGSILIIIGHRFANNDLYQFILNESEDKEKWRNAFRVTPAIDKITGKCNFPKRFGENGEKLPSKKELIGTALYNTYYNLDPSGLKGQKFKDLWWKIYDPKILDTKNIIWFDGTDLATGENPDDELSDWFAIVRIGIDLETRQIYIDDVRRAKIEMPEQEKEVISFYKDKPPERFFIESNQCQVFLPQALKVNPEAKAMKIIAVKNTGNKEIRIDGLTIPFSNGHILINQDMIGLPGFKTEYQEYPAGHDDQLDALEMVIREAFILIDKIIQEREDKLNLMRTSISAGKEREKM